VVQRRNGPYEGVARLSFLVFDKHRLAAEYSRSKTSLEIDPAVSYAPWLELEPKVQTVKRDPRGIL
jgi:hypothetical protein